MSANSIATNWLKAMHRQNSGGSYNAFRTLRGLCPTGEHSGFELYVGAVAFLVDRHERSHCDGFPIG